MHFCTITIFFFDTFLCKVLSFLSALSLVDLKMANYLLVLHFSPRSFCRLPRSQISQLTVNYANAARSTFCCVRCTFSATEFKRSKNSKGKQRQEKSVILDKLFASTSADNFPTSSSTQHVKSHKFPFFSYVLRNDK